jgi:hypothetical protein
MGHCPQNKIDDKSAGLSEQASKKQFFSTQPATFPIPDIGIGDPFALVYAIAR